MFVELMNFIERKSISDIKLLHLSSLSEVDINKAREKYLTSKGYIPIEKTETSYEEKLKECDYIMNTINNTILKTIENGSYKTQKELDINKLKHLRTESFETCENYNNYKQSLEKLNIGITVYKNTLELNEVSFNLMYKVVSVYH
jgi:hypothetical protein